MSIRSEQLAQTLITTPDGYDVEGANIDVDKFVIATYKTTGSSNNEPEYALGIFKIVSHYAGESVYGRIDPKTGRIDSKMFGLPDSKANAKVSKILLNKKNQTLSCAIVDIHMTFDEIRRIMFANRRIGRHKSGKATLEDLQQVLRYSNELFFSQGNTQTFGKKY